MASEWFWEGNVQHEIARFLVDEGWTDVHEADTASRAQGVDVVARRGPSRLAVEVKGYPSTRYADPARAHEVKRTNPTNQAVHWYAQAILKAMRLRFATNASEVAIGLPDFPRYRNLVAETKESLSLLGIGLYFVREDGRVDRYLDHVASGKAHPAVSANDRRDTGGAP